MPQESCSEFASQPSPLMLASGPYSGISRRSLQETHAPADVSSRAASHAPGLQDERGDMAHSPPLNRRLVSRAVTTGDTDSAIELRVASPNKYRVTPVTDRTVPDTKSTVEIAPASRAARLSSRPRESHPTPGSQWSSSRDSESRCRARNPNPTLTPRPTIPAPPSTRPTVRHLLVLALPCLGANSDRTAARSGVGAGAALPGARTDCAEGSSFGNTLADAAGASCKTGTWISVCSRGIASKCCDHSTKPGARATNV